MSLPFSKSQSSFDQYESYLDRKRKPVDQANEDDAKRQGAQDRRLAALSPFNVAASPSQSFAPLPNSMINGHSMINGRSDEPLVNASFLPNHVHFLQGGRVSHFLDHDVPQSLHESPSDLVAFLQSQRFQQQPTLLQNHASVNRAPLALSDRDMAVEFALNPVQMAIAQLLRQEEAKQQCVDHNLQMRMYNGLTGGHSDPFGALARFDQTNQTLPLPPLDHNLWSSHQQQALLREHYFRSNSNSVEPNWIHASRTSPLCATPDRGEARAVVVPQELDSNTLQAAWPAAEAPNTNRKVPPSIQLSTFNSSKTVKIKTAAVAGTKSVEPSPCHFVPRPLAHDNDHLVLSQHQIFLRQQIEVFCATEADINVRTRGRNKRITLGQVGIRCRFCAHLPCRQKGSLYYPSSTLGLYQAAQNMSTTHMQCGLCVAMPDKVKKQFADLIPTKTLGSLRGRSYWSNSAKEMGLVDTVDQGIRYVPPKP
jgi:hypothetical protein